jgi:peptidyl-prolyl cis-trans isomerase C
MNIKRLYFAIIVLLFFGCEKIKKKEPAPVSQWKEDAALPPGLSPEDAKKILAKIDDVVITVGEFTRRINRQSPFARMRFNSPERRREFLDDLIRFELLAKEAKARGYDKDPDVQRTMKNVMIQKLTQLEIEKKVKLADITEEEMRRYYEENKYRYNQPEKVRVSQIVIKDKRKAQRILREIKAKRQDSQFFREMVRQHSEDEITKRRGGDLYFFPRVEDRREGDMKIDPAIVKAAFSIKEIRDVYPKLIQTPKGYHIIRLEGRRREIKRSFEDVKRQIQHTLWQEKRQKTIDALVERLKKKAKVKIYEDRLSKVVVDTSRPSLRYLPTISPKPVTPQKR